MERGGKPECAARCQSKGTETNLKEGTLAPAEEASAVVEEASAQIEAKSAEPALEEETVAAEEPAVPEAETKSSQSGQTSAEAAMPEDEAAAAPAEAVLPGRNRSGGNGNRYP